MLRTALVQGMKRATAVRRLSTQVSLPALPYAYDALEPTISADIMELHHSKHHQAYVNNLNVALEALSKAEADGDVTKILQLHSAIKFNGGGHLNHSIFWMNLCPASESGAPAGELLDLINKSFGSVDAMKEKLTAASVAIQGSGWGWLGYNKDKDVIEVATCANQDPLEATTGLVPLFGIDVWEHAYNRQYANRRPDYVKAIFDVANWADVARRLAEAKA